jgi:glutamate synthase (NADPH/NADH) small chain
VIVAVGTRANPLLTASSPDLALTARGYLAADEQGMTNLPGVFAGGDIVRGSATVILAMGDGKRIAGTIDQYLSGTKVALNSRRAVMAAVAGSGAGGSGIGQPTGP